ncbi:acetoacetate--CoA ligase [Photobacterium aphoticum]|nr:acetoacetate--CoA ligase [Photobacterium aphoticum]PSU59502.1 acetoacetate--CoA ligase [Photobacterium aphoticum]GHA40215.1 acetoacetyl-CoA synthetase [Photobacterium aphoticum]
MTAHNDSTPPSATHPATLSPTILWTPSPERVQTSLLKRFMHHLESCEHGTYSAHGPFANYAALHRWSIENSPLFWDTLWDFCDVIGAKKPPVTYCDPSSTTPAKDTQWFPHAKLNYAENLLTHWQQHADRPALTAYREGQTDNPDIMTWQTLYQHTAQLAQYLHHAGVGKGDVVAGYLPNIPHTVIAMLATSALGAIWTSTSPDFGVDSVVERFGQTAPKVLFFADGYTFNGQPHHLHDKVAAIIEQLPTLTHCVSVSYLKFDADKAESKGTSSFTVTHNPTLSIQHWEGIIHHDHAPIIELGFTPVPFNHPLCILYSSGTTGKPKCIVHTVGGTLLNHLKEHQLHSDIHPGDTLFYYTTCGWMMWNWLISGLASGASLVLYDGSPFYPNGQILWDIAEQASITQLGVSAKYLEALEKQAVHPKHTHALPSLRTLFSTGSVLAPEQFDFVYQHIHGNIQLASISGGTDICGCFALGNPLSPVYRGECQGRALAMDVQVFSSQGKPVEETQGELVCTNSFPNQPWGFWQDPDGRRYHHAYWETFPNVWHHGDYVSLQPSGGMVFYGRSDAVLNPGGVRIGTAEIYRQVNRFEEIVDAVVISQDMPALPVKTQPGDDLSNKTQSNATECEQSAKSHDVRVVLFVQLTQDAELDDALKAQISQRIREQCSPRHVPAVIVAVNDIPRTRSGKLVELAVRQVVHHQPVNNVGALANPASLDEFKDRPELAL